MMRFWKRKKNSKCHKQVASLENEEGEGGEDKEQKSSSVKLKIFFFLKRYD